MRQNFIIKCTALLCLLTAGLTACSLDEAVIRREEAKRTPETSTLDAGQKSSGQPSETETKTMTQKQISQIQTERSSDIPDYRLLKFNPDPLISTEEELNQKHLLSPEEVFLLAEELNTYGEFHYVLTKANNASELSILDQENHITAIVQYDKTYCFVKEITFRTSKEQTAGADKMIWFARLLFGNLPADALLELEENALSREYLYQNGEILYRYYLFYYEDNNYETQEEYFTYSFSECYHTVKQYEEFFSDSEEVTIPQLPVMQPDKRMFRVDAGITDLEMDESGDYYNAILTDGEDHSLPCKIVNIRGEHTADDIKNATVFFGDVMSGYFNVRFYMQE